jgi:membrane-associated phospholipid phosphatase
MKKKILNFLIIGLLITFISYSNAQNPDIEILRKINSNPSTFLRNYSTVLSNSTTAVGMSFPIVLGTAAFITHDEEMLKSAITSGISLGIAAGLTYGLKTAIGRPRPAITWPDLITPYEDIHSKSLPSGHTSFAFAAATSLSIHYPEWYIILPAYLWAGSVGYSRMNLGVHYPSDVISAAILGAGSAYLSYKINNWLYPKVNPVKKLKFDEYFL